MITQTTCNKILVSALAAKVIPVEEAQLISFLAGHFDVIEVAQTLGSSRIVRALRLAIGKTIENTSPQLDQQGKQILYKSCKIGEVQILYKTPLPGELQARLAIEGIIERFLDYLQKVYQIIVLNESDRHVQVFIPNKPIQDLSKLWISFLRDVAFSTYGNTKYQLPGLAQTFILMLNTVTLSKYGFSKLDVPIITQDQATVLTALYFAVFRDVKKRQDDRYRQIEQLQKALNENELSEKDRKKKTKDLQDKQEKQLKEEQKYTENFQKLFAKTLEEQNILWQELKFIQTKLLDSQISVSERKKLQKQQDKLREKIIFSHDLVEQKISLVNQSEGNPFKFVELDQQNNLDKFSKLASIVKKFSKTATDQISSTKGDIFALCILEMYRLMESNPSESLPPPLLTEQPILASVRSPGDDHKQFCYSCGVALDSKTARWQVARFMFERPYQRRQSSSREEQPYICASCSVLSFASPLKVTDKSIILRLDPRTQSNASKQKLTDYVRMLTSKEIHLNAGRYIVLNSDQTNSGELASQKLGQVQFALAKIASIFPIEVLTDFLFSLLTQGSQPISLYGRQLIFIKGLMESYGQSIVVAGKEINLTLGNAIRYVQQDLPYFADYTLVKVASVSDTLQLEQVRKHYWNALKNDSNFGGERMNSDDQLPKRARLYTDVAALTGITYAFAQSLEDTAKKVMKTEDAEREVSKLIEKVDDVVAFSYYATLGDEKKTSVQARLYYFPDKDFIYTQAKELLKKLGITDREQRDDKGKAFLQFYVDDLTRIYTHFATEDYAQDKDWKDLTYNLKLSLYTRFPELVRKLKSTGDK